MKSSSIICCCKATLQGLLIGDTSVSGNGRADMGVQPSVTPFYPEGSVHNESDSDDDVIKMGPSTMCLRTVLGYGGIVDLVSSEAWQLHYRQCIIPSNMGKGHIFKKVYGFTINNETQMAFYTSWLAMQGYFCFSYYTPLGFFLIEF